MKRKNTKLIVISVTLILLIILCCLFLLLNSETKEQKESREFLDNVIQSGQEYEEFNRKIDEETQRKLDLLESGYDVSTKSYFSSPENIKLRYELEKKGYTFNSINKDDESSTYFSNDTYNVLGIINTKNGQLIDLKFNDANVERIWL